MSKHFDIVLKHLDRRANNPRLSIQERDRYKMLANQLRHGIAIDQQIIDDLTARLAERESRGGEYYGDLMGRWDDDDQN